MALVTRKKKQEPMIKTTEPEVKENIGKKKTSESVATKMQQSKVAEIREKVEELRIELKSISFAKASSKFDKEDLLTYEKRIERLCSTLDKVSVLDLDTRKMDENMLYLAQHLQDNIEKGNIETTKRMMDALYYGVMIGHEPIKSTEKRKEEKIIATRTDRYNKFRDIVNLSEQIDEAMRDMGKKGKEFDKLKNEFDEKFGILEKKIKANQKAVEELDRYGASDRDTISDEAYDLWVDMQEANAIKNNTKELRNLMVQSREFIINIENEIRQLEITLSSVVLENDEELTENLERYRKDYIQQQREMQEAIERSRESSRQFIASMEELFSARVMAPKIIQGMREWKKLEQQVENERAAAAANQRILEEQQLEEEQEQQQVVW